jgi:WhiB family redox-sensing transcriptional regulator
MTPDWVEHALCREIGPALFERADDDSPGGGHRYDDARQVCGRCVVRAQCLDEAMRREGGSSHEYRSGMFGGMSPRQRARHYPTWQQEAAA